MFGGVLKALVVLFVSSQYNLWSMAHEEDYSFSFLLGYKRPQSDGQDDLTSWLYGPSKNVPIYRGQDPLDQWLYGPSLSQKTNEDTLSTQAKTLQTTLKKAETSEKLELSSQTFTDNTSHVTSVDVPSDSVSCDDGSDDDVPYAPRNIKYPF
ncbi:hypothetical protein MACJ_002609 [Theileria orientalis]|uniref:Uncharacterized protein n=1 Tax=Theileria orientalis TaxID=68886 RepID=A0A976M6B4_THEOR|nr:hypothetical protein MACJ_002609 [Theileria orientalis]